MTSIVDQIPGYREAVAAEERRRLLAFVAVNEDLCGLQVKPMTLGHIITLSAIRNAFVEGMEPRISDVLQVLTILHPHYETDRKKARKEAIKAILKTGGMVAAQQIQGFIREALADLPGSSDDSEKAGKWAWPATLVDMLASEYGWTEAEIFSCPVKRALQYMRVITRRHDPKAILVNESDTVKASWLEKLNTPK